MFYKRFTLWIIACLLLVGYNDTLATNSKATKIKKTLAGRAKSTSQSNTQKNTMLLAKAAVITPSVNQTTDKQDNSKGNEYQPISFDLLGGYEYEEPNILNKTDAAKFKSKIPENIRALNDKKVVIRGYFYPVEIGSNGAIKDFMLLRNQIYCCFGDAVQINEWLSAVNRNGKPLTSNFNSSVVRLYGTLEVGEKFDNGCLIDLYRMKVDKIEGE